MYTVRQVSRCVSAHQNADCIPKIIKWYFAKKKLRSNHFPHLTVIFHSWSPFASNGTPADSATPTITALNSIQVNYTFLFQIICVLFKCRSMRDCVSVRSTLQEPAVSDGSGCAFIVSSSAVSFVRCKFYQTVCVVI